MFFRFPEPLKGKEVSAASRPPENREPKHRKEEKTANFTVVSGNLGKDPEPFHTQEGGVFCSLDLAFRSYGDKTNWIRASCKDRLAEACLEHLEKGSKVVVAGVLDQTKWEDDQGNQRTSFRVLANSVDFLGPPPRRANATATTS